MQTMYVLLGLPGYEGRIRDVGSIKGGKLMPLK